MNQSEIQRFTSWLGKRSYAARVERLGIERIREIARENGKKGGVRRKRVVRDECLQARGRVVVQVPFRGPGDPRILEEREQDGCERSGALPAAEN